MENNFDLKNRMTLRLTFIHTKSHDEKRHHFSSVSELLSPAQWKDWLPHLCSPQFLLSSKLLVLICSGDHDTLEDAVLWCLLPSLKFRPWLSIWALTSEHFAIWPWCYPLWWQCPKAFQEFYERFKSNCCWKSQKMPKKSLTHWKGCQINPVLESYTILSALELLTEGAKGPIGWDFGVWRFLLVVVFFCQSTLKGPEMVSGKNFPGRLNFYQEKWIVHYLSITYRPDYMHIRQSFHAWSRTWAS